MSQTILIIDDEADIRDILADIFIDEGYNVLKAAHSEQALSLITNNKIDLIVLDIWLDNSDMDGVQILKHLKSGAHKNIPILMISGHGNVEMAVNAMKMGAFDFIEKPFKIDHILLTVNRALEQKSLKEENTRLRDHGGTMDIIHHKYKSVVMGALIKSIEDNADSDARILITGEKGTGKSYVGRLIHSVSRRSKNYLDTINCYDVNFERIEKSLSEHPNGTLILENIETLDLNAQSNLLNLLNKNTCSCRIIATCDVDMSHIVNDKKFSSSLYDRLAILKYTAPSLKNRRDDIDILVTEFITSICLELHIDRPSLSKKVYDLLRRYTWPGNIRQLKVAIEWIVINSYFNSDEETLNSNIQFLLQENILNDSNVVPYKKHTTQQESQQNLYDYPLKTAREMFEKNYLINMLEKYDGNIAKIAEHIDMERTALYRKLKSMNITYGDDQTAKANQS